MVLNNLYWQLLCLPSEADVLFKEGSLLCLVLMKCICVCFLCTYLYVVTKWISVYGRVKDCLLFRISHSSQMYKKKVKCLYYSYKQTRTSVRFKFEHELSLYLQLLSWNDIKWNCDFYWFLHYIKTGNFSVLNKVFKAFMLLFSHICFVINKSALFDLP